MKLDINNLDEKREFKDVQSHEEENSHEYYEHCKSEQSHTHEFLGSVKLVKSCEDTHNHRFAGVTSETIPLHCGWHKHTFLVNTDYYDHLHEVSGETGPAIPVGNGKHVHFVCGKTTIDDRHYHDFQFATLIEKPLLPDED